MLNIGWFSTGRGEGSLGLLQFIHQCLQSGEIDARIQFVFSNRAPGEAEGSDRFFKKANEFGLPLVTLSSQEFRRTVGGRFADHREEYDRQVIARLDGFEPDVCVLAGYMLIVGTEMCHRYTMLNLHPALPDGPIGTWQEVIWSLIETKAKVTGSMIHLVTEEVDRGPVLAYSSLPIVGEDYDPLWRDAEGKLVADLQVSPGEELSLFKHIRREGYRREPWLLATALKALAEDRVQVDGGRIYSQGDLLAVGLCLDEEVERALAGA